MVVKAVPSTAVRLDKEARKAGWQSKIISSSGSWKGKETDLVVVRLDKGDKHAVAQWVNGKADTCWVWPRDDGALSHHKIKQRDLLALVKAG